ncbi:hypothetical protein F0562_022296 [Nyssa sinensis]|uniref:Uncharacterized protein n=1 Tax=Nyssa sinensis TaxID=561372 RepID=A0A5J5BNR2_9ASTE|nr:hypothetical protein F0562_022296 [Nyssa sinensis]
MVIVKESLLAMAIGRRNIRFLLPRTRSYSFGISDSSDLWISSDLLVGARAGEFSHFSEIDSRGAEGSGLEQIIQPRDWRDCAQGEDEGQIET